MGAVVIAIALGVAWRGKLSEQAAIDQPVKPVIGGQAPEPVAVAAAPAAPVTVPAAPAAAPA
ncbi:MAG: hypothetical protein Q8M69_24170, partial [Reyranella sp.]|nr:hypothetical protein [Reyranella sp.]